MNELDQALYTALTSGTALTALLAGTTSVYYGVAPHDVDLDYVVFNQQSGPYQQLAPSHELLDSIYQVKGISDTSMLKAGQIAAQIQAVMDTALTISAHTNLWQERTARVRFIEVTAEGERFYHSGYLYRIRLEVD
jgi:hypothetical protein